LARTCEKGSPRVEVAGRLLDERREAWKKRKGGYSVVTPGKEKKKEMGETRAQPMIKETPSRQMFTIKEEEGDDNQEGQTGKLRPVT